MNTLPILYKKTSTGAIQFWEIGVRAMSEGIEQPLPGTTGRWPDMFLGEIVTKYGQLGTESPQITSDMVTKGKNKGKINATNAVEQAMAEAQAKWEKQKKKGYVESIDGAKADETDDLITGGVVPMLAQKYSEQGHKIKYPCSVQPKLDGIRCVAIIKDGECTLWSRTRKPITSCPHIVAELEAAFASDGEIILDGELYNHEMKADFEKIVSLVRQEEPGEGHEIVQYHVYDVINDSMPFKDRTEVLETLFDTYEFFSLKMVETETVLEEDEVMDFFEIYRKQGYEGAMLRNDNSLYVNKRSYDLQKVKEFDDAEFPIVGIEEGRGKLAGHAIFQCKTDSGKVFLAKLKGDTARLKAVFEDPKLWQGKKLTVQYQGLTGKEGVPRFPVGVEIRDYE